MRLIDADALVKSILSQTIMDKQDAEIMDRYLYVIKNQPTAYDIDKVVEELYEERTEILLSNDYENEIINYCLDNYDRAIEIVKQHIKGAE